MAAAAQMEMKDGPYLAPAYVQADLSAPIVLGEVEATLTIDGRHLQGNAKATIEFNPKPREHVDISFVDPPPKAQLLHRLYQIGPTSISGWDGTINISQPSSQLKTEFRGINDDGSFRFLIRGDLTRPDKATAISVAHFSLFNFPEFIGAEDYAILHSPGQQNSGWTRCGKVTMSAGGWRITIAGLLETAKRSKSLKGHQGYALTHVGCVTRDDGAAFSAEHLDELLQCLHYFFSFCLGSSRHCTLPVGYDSKQVAVFRRWSLPTLSPAAWTGGFSCFDPNHAQMFTQFFPGFFSVWERSIWKVPLEEAIYWYLNANENPIAVPIDVGVILAQTALELLAWNYCVPDRKLVSPRAFGRGGLSASDKIRLLLRSLDIPSAVPAECEELIKWQPQKIKDAPDAITLIRNALVHPSAERTRPEVALRDAWTLSLWLIELAILRVCNYMGEYGNRVKVGRWVGQVEGVPWRPRDQDSQSQQGASS